jgi:hypothetical protein
MKFLGHLIEFFRVQGRSQIGPMSFRKEKY